MALLWAAGTGIGDKRDGFYLGGFPDQDILRTVFLGRPYCCGFLRGYPAFSLRGESQQLFSAEYRAPLVRIEHGYSTFPLYFRRLWGAAFVDSGNAFNGPFRPADLKTDVGVEVTLQFNVAYYVESQLKSATRTASRRPAATSGISSPRRSFYSGGPRSSCWKTCGAATLRAVTASFVGLLLGIAMGARHALDPDHLAAVSVLAADAPGARRGAVLGAMWGIGHAIALLATALVLATLAAELPPALCDAFELVVAAMLVFLGGRAVRRAFRDGDRGPRRCTRTAGSRTSTRAPARTCTSRNGRSRCGR